MKKKVTDNLTGPGPGRPKGVPNKVTVEFRQFFGAFLEKNVSKMQGLLDRVATDDPGLALRILLDVSEFCLPKLARIEHTGADGEALPHYVVASEPLSSEQWAMKYGPVIKHAEISDSATSH